MGQYEIWMFLKDHEGEKFSLRDLVRETGMSYNGVGRCMRKLRKFVRSSCVPGRFHEPQYTYWVENSDR